MPGWIKDAEAVRKEIENIEHERQRRQTRVELLAQRARIMDRIEQQLRLAPDSDLMRRYQEFKKDTSWIENDDPLTRALLDAADPARKPQWSNRLQRYSYDETPLAPDDPGKIKMEERPSRRRPFLDFYKRIFARKAGSRGLHGEDDHGVLPEGGAAVSGGTAGGPSAGGESDADAGGTAERGGQRDGG
jgi:hypothetical protein